MSDTKIVIDSILSSVRKNAHLSWHARDYLASFFNDVDSIALATDALQGLKTDRQQLRMLRELRDMGRYSAAGESHARQWFERFIKQLPMPTMPLTQTLLAMERMTQGDNPAKKESIEFLRARLTNSLNAAQEVMLTAMGSDSRVMTPALLDLVADTLPQTSSPEALGVLVCFAADARLIRQPSQESSSAQTKNSVWRIGQYIVDHIDLLPLGHTQQLLRICPTRTEIAEHLLERATNHPGEAPTYPYRYMSSREESAYYDQRAAIETLVQNDLWNPTPDALLHAVDRVSKHPATDKDAQAGYLLKIAQAALSQGNDSNILWQNLETTLRPLGLGVFDSIAANIITTWPTSRWDAIQELFLEWLAGPVRRKDEHVLAAPAFAAAVRKGLKNTPSATLEGWLRGLRSSKHLSYLMRLIAETHGYSVGIQERLRITMATSDDPETRKMAIFLPEAPSRAPPPAQSVRKRKGSP